jgi:hypothetical protein
MTLRVIQTALAQKRPDGRWFTPTPYFAADHRNSPLSITEIPQGTSGVEGLI